MTWDESSAHVRRLKLGDRITVRNPHNGKVFPITHKDWKGVLHGYKAGTKRTDHHTIMDTFTVTEWLTHLEFIA